MICGISPDLFWTAPLSLLSDVVADHSAYINWMTSEQRKELERNG